MKRLIFLAAALLVAVLGSAQVSTPDGRIVAHDIFFSIAGGRINVAMQIDAMQAALHRREAIVLTPLIVKGDQRAELTPIVIGGKNRLRVDARARYFGRKLPYNADVALASSAIPYVGSADYQSWMGGAMLVLREDTYGCNYRHVSIGSVDLTALRPVEPVVPAVTPAVIYITPEAEPVKNRAESGEAFLEFQSGKSVILPDFRGNAAELGKIRTMIDALRGDEAVSADGITLTGYASPEGSFASNSLLSQARADALRGYIQTFAGYPATMFRVGSGSEDWEGLRALVDKSSITNKAAILAIIASVEQPDIKERHLRALSNYSELLGDYFPKLRRVNYRMDYTVRAFSVEEGRSVVRTNPGRMSLSEMFLVAQSYPAGSPDFKQVFDVAVRNFPTDPVANLNAGAMLLEAGDVAGAARYITPYAAAHEGWNNLGVLQMLQGDYPAARASFSRAAASPEVVHNLAALERLEAYAKAKAEYDAY